MIFLQSHRIIITVLIVLWILGFLFIYDQREKYLHQQIETVVNKRVELLRQYTNVALVVVDAMRKQMESNIHLAEKGNLTHPAFQALQDRPDLNAYFVGDPLSDLYGISGVLTGLGSKNDLSQDTINELHAVLSLDLYLGKAALYNPDFVWSYYTSKKHFLYLVPKVSVDDFHFQNTTYQKPFWQSAIPEHNANKDIVISELYNDEAGQGFMISISAPVYVNNEFRGVISLDIGLDKMRASLLSDDLVGESLLINPKGRLIAAPFEFEIGDEVALPAQRTFGELTWDKDYEYFMQPVMQGQMYLLHRIKNSQILNSISLDISFYVLVLTFVLLIVYLLYRLHHSMQQLTETLTTLRETQTQLIQSEKMAALGQLIAGIAHEINTPIGAIKSSGDNISHSLEQTLQTLSLLYQKLKPEEETMFIELLHVSQSAKQLLTSREERQLSRALTKEMSEANIEDARHKAGVLVQLQAHENWQHFLPLILHQESEFILDTAYNLASISNNIANINQAVDRVGKIIYALKSFSRQDMSDKKINSDIIEGVETVLTLYHNQIKQNTQLVREYQPVPAIPCYPDELNQVWTNLIHNALQAMKYNGTLTIRIETKDERLIVAITDTGCGIPKENQDKIFMPFYTTKDRGEGSGLGLDIVQKIVQKHNGQISFDSVVGQGTTFYVALPLE